MLVTEKDDFLCLYWLNGVRLQSGGLGLGSMARGGGMKDVGPALGWGPGHCRQPDCELYCSFKIV